MRSQAVVQIALILISFVIIFTYIKPVYGELQATQEEVSEYRAALDNADQFNQELQRLVTRANSFSATQMADLDRYLPTEVDVVSVMRDISLIIEQNQTSLESITSEGLREFSEQAASGQGQEVGVALPLEPVQFVVSLSGRYDSLKSVLHDLERNAYPLEVKSLTISTRDETDEVEVKAGVYTFDMTLETYQLRVREE